MSWLRREKRCALVLFERSPRPPIYSRPDVLGIMASRYMAEVEIKRSLSDFRANASKPHVRHRDLYLARWPRWFYYMAEPALAGRLEAELPDWAGLLTADDWQARVVRRAPDNKASEKLSVKACVRLLHVVGNQIYASERDAWLARQGSGHEPLGVEYQI